MSTTISVVIPVYNEVSTIGEIINRVQSIDIDKEIIIIDDGSTDGTKEYLQSIGKKNNRNQKIKTFFHERNLGKGAALQTGFREATNDIVIIQDADLEYDPTDYHRLIKPITQGIADVVYGSRFIGGTHRVLYYWHYLGNGTLTMLSNMLTNMNLSDVWTCYKAFRLDVIKKIDLKEKGFGFEAEITAKIAKLDLRIYEVPISYYGRTYKEGKKITWKDGFKAFWYVIRYNLFQ